VVTWAEIPRVRGERKDNVRAGPPLAIRVGQETIGEACLLTVTLHLTTHRKKANQISVLLRNISAMMNGQTDTSETLQASCIWEASTQ
jgi:hypothetical protein